MNIHAYAYSVGKRPSNRGWGDSSAQSEKCLPHKPENKVHFLEIYIKKNLSMLECSNNPSAGDMKTGGFLGITGQSS